VEPGAGLDAAPLATPIVLRRLWRRGSFLRA